MKNIFLFLIALFATYLLQAQKFCSVKKAEAYFSAVRLGYRPVTIDFEGKTTENISLLSANISIYFISNCSQMPVILFSTIGKTKIKLEFIRIKTNNDEVGTDDQSNPKIIKAPKNTFLWKATCAVSSKTEYLETEKVNIGGTIGSKKFNVSNLSLIILQPVAMY